MQIQRQHHGRVGIQQRRHHAVLVDQAILQRCIAIQQRRAQGIQPLVFEIDAGGIGPVVARDHAIQVVHRHDPEDVTGAQRPAQRLVGQHGSDQPF